MAAMSIFFIVMRRREQTAGAESGYPIAAYAVIGARVSERLVS